MPAINNSRTSQTPQLLEPEVGRGGGVVELLLLLERVADEAGSRTSGLGTSVAAVSVMTGACFSSVTIIHSLEDN